MYLLKSLRLKRIWTGFFVLLILLSLQAVGFAHAHLQSSLPAEDEIVQDSPTTVQLTFTEPVHVDESVFRVYALTLNDDSSSLHEQAGELASAVLDAVTRRQQHDESDRADTGLTETNGTVAEITILLKNDLEPGPYVVMWKVRSVDTHITDEYFVFHYEPTE